MTDTPIECRTDVLITYHPGGPRDYFGSCEPHAWQGPRRSYETGAESDVEAHLALYQLIAPRAKPPTTDTPQDDLVCDTCGLSPSWVDCEDQLVKVTAERDGAQYAFTMAMESRARARAERDALLWAEALTQQTCAAGKHSEWFVDSEFNHLCPWCTQDALQARLDAWERRVNLVASSLDAGDDNDTWTLREVRRTFNAIRYAIAFAASPAPESDPDGEKRWGFYIDPRDWWIGYYRGDTHHYVCPLPCVVIRWARGEKR